MKKISLVSIAMLFYAALFAQNLQQATIAENRMDGLKKRKTSALQSLVKNIKFRNIGPSVMSGRVVDIDVNPEKSTEFFVAYATGGIWYSNNNGQSFTPVFDEQDHLFIGDIAVDWKSGTIYAGTGEVNASRSTYAGTGIYKSTDKGKTWQFAGLPDTHHIGKVLISPDNPNTVWVAAMGHLYSSNKERGIFKTTDGGKTWNKTLYIDDKTGGIDLDIDPKNSRILYSAMWYRTRTPWNFEESGKTSGIYKSLDGGNTWTLVTTAASGFPTGNGVGRIGLSVSAVNPDIVYAALDNNDSRPQKKDTSGKYTLLQFRKITKEEFVALDDKKLDAFLRENRFPEDVHASTIKEQVLNDKMKPTVLADYLKDGNSDMLVNEVKGAEVYKSIDGGKSWKKTNDEFLDGFSSYGYYLSKIWASPIHPGKLVMTGVPLLLSEDDGKTWKPMGGGNVHSDHHAFWFDPKDDSHMINGNDGGLNISYDDGKNWYKANSPAVGQFYSIVVDTAKPYNVFGGLQDNGVWYGPSNNIENTNWHATGDYAFKSINGGDGMMVQVDTRRNNLFYSGSQFGYYSRSNKERTESMPIHPMHKLGETPLRWNWETPILLSKFNQDIFYMASNKFHRSMNKGENMETLSGDLTRGGRAGDVPYGTATWIAESPLKFGTLYLGTDDGLVQLSRDGGYNWTKISDKLPQDQWIACITPSAFKDSRVYVSLNGYRYDNFSPYLYVSEDFGISWKSINGNLPPEPINTMKEDPKNENILYVGTDQGLYVSIDRGMTYMPFVNGLPRVPVHDIAIQLRENEIVLGTHGRSVYIAALDVVQKLTPELLSKAIELFDIKEVTINTFAGRGRSARPTAAINYFVKNGGKSIIRIKNDKGTVVNTIARNDDAGINIFEFNLSADSASAKTLNISEATDKNYYLGPGTYQVEIENGSAKIAKPLVIKATARRQYEDAEAEAGENEENDLNR